MNTELKFSDFPRKAKKAIKRNFMRTIDPAWEQKEVRIKRLIRRRLTNTGDYKSWTVCSYHLGVN